MRRSLGALAASAVVGLLGVLAGAQDQQQPPASGLQQDRAEITGTIDSWYKVLQGEDYRGYLRESLERVAAGGAWRYTYSFEEDLEIFVPDPNDPSKEIPSVRSRRGSAKLDDTYAPVDMEVTLQSDNDQLIYSVTSSDQGRQLVLILSSTERRSTPLGTTDLHYSLSLLFFSLRQNGLLAKPGLRKANLLFPQIEGEPIVEIDFEVGAMLKRNYLDKVVSVTRITFVKPPPAKRGSELYEAFVDKYGRIVEMSTRDDVRWVLVKGEAEAVESGSVVRLKGRRDPFRKDLAMSGRAGEGEEGAKKEARFKVDISTDNLTKRLEEAEMLLEDLKKAKEESRQTEGEEIYQKILVYHDALRKATRDEPQEVQRRVEELRRQTEEIWGGAQRLLAQLRLVYIRSISQFKADRCAELETSIEDLRKGLERIEVQGTSQELEIRKWVVELEPKLAKCRTRLELLAKQLLLSGTVSYDEEILQPINASLLVLGHQIGVAYEVRFTKPNRLAIINGQMYRVGDVVEGQGVRIEKILRHGVQVSLREETRDVSIQQGGGASGGRSASGPRRTPRPLKRR